MTPFEGFDTPNFTTIPNQFFNDLLKDIKEVGELKVTLIALRETFGYHRPDAELAVNFFVIVGGMSVNTVRRGLDKAIARGTLFKVKDETNRDGAWYRVRMSQDVREKLASTSRGSAADPPNGNGVSTVATLGGQPLTPLNKGKKSLLYKSKERSTPLKRKFSITGALSK